MNEEQQQHLDRGTTLIREKLQTYVGTSNVTPALMEMVQREVLASLLPIPSGRVNIEIAADGPDKIVCRLSSADPISNEALRQLTEAMGRVGAAVNLTARDEYEDELKEGPMAAFIDITCDACGERYGWYGTLTDAKPCPHCGESPDKAEAAAVEAQLDVVREQLDEEAGREWAARAREQDQAYRDGYAAWRPGQKTTDLLRLNPYSRRSTGDDHPLRGWWSMGWNAAWSDGLSKETDDVE